MELLIFIIGMSGLVWFTYKLAINYPVMPTPLGFSSTEADKLISEPEAPLGAIPATFDLSLKEKIIWDDIVFSYKMEDEEEI